MAPALNEPPEWPWMNQVSFALTVATLGLATAFGLSARTPQAVRTSSEELPLGPRATPVPPVPSEPVSAPDSPALAEVAPDALASTGIPEVASRAYHAAAGALAVSAPRCGLDWSLLAAIGRVETDHGRFGGAVLRQDGTTAPPIRGPRLDGPPFAVVTDTDGGRVDGDPAFDRAVGPMQFLPGTWRAVHPKGDPDNIFDAAVGAGLYLCSGSAVLSDPAQRRAAVLRYNHSDSYADTVLALAVSYRDGTRDVPLVIALAPPLPPKPASVPTSSGEPSTAVTTIATTTPTTAPPSTTPEPPAAPGTPPSSVPPSSSEPAPPPSLLDPLLGPLLGLLRTIVR
ncbi:lytic transglycosylase [Lentzea sp. NPDC059081]|uniref:lytic transglycosylase n=1 Tax=Lentzea sp. NPDC059081 TaxID=3346719 RepID=UPI0036B9740B